MGGWTDAHHKRLQAFYGSNSIIALIVLMYSKVVLQHPPTSSPPRAFISRRHTHYLIIVLIKHQTYPEYRSVAALADTLYAESAASL
jgi:hypothetical protein